MSLQWGDHRNTKITLTVVLDLLGKPPFESKSDWKQASCSVRMIDWKHASCDVRMIDLTQISSKCEYFGHIIRLQMTLHSFRKQPNQQHIMCQSQKDGLAFGPDFV